MVESGSRRLSEEVMLGAVVFGHEQGNVATPSTSWCAKRQADLGLDRRPRTKPLIAKVTALAEGRSRGRLPDPLSKQARTQAAARHAAFFAALSAEGAPSTRSRLTGLLFEIEARIVRSQILAGEPRIDGRDTRTVRPIEIRNSVLPRTHGSALFTRGETQALVVATLGTDRDEQRIDALDGEFEDRFMLHYNMPRFATGERAASVRPKRREIGHGRLAKRALIACRAAEQEDFPYSLRVVSEITESTAPRRWLPSAAAAWR